MNEYTSGKRSLMRVVMGAFDVNQYVALSRISVYRHPVGDFFYRYVLGRGAYPHVCLMRRASGTDIAFHTRSIFDMFTITEIFGWRCYPVSGSEKTVVDFGANIGISMAWFLANCPDARVFGFEPLQSNRTICQRNLTDFAGRYEVDPRAVWNYTGEVLFGVEETGRYSGVGVAQRQTEVSLPCIKASDAIARILDLRSDVDLLKIDIEGGEREVLQDLTDDQLRRIKLILVEGVAIPRERLTRIGMRIRHLPSGIDHIDWPPL